MLESSGENATFLQHFSYKVFQGRSFPPGKTVVFDILAGLNSVVSNGHKTNNRGELEMDNLALRNAVGSGIRRKRLEHRMTLSEVARKLGISYQQIQKYESGQNSISCEKLVKLSELFGCRIDELCGLGEASAEPGLDLLVRYYRKIPSPIMREAACGIMAVLARSNGSE